MARLCATALAHGIEVAYVRALVHKRGLRVNPLEPFGLTNREAEVLKWVAEGKRDGEIAVILGLSARTVSHHLERTYRKLNVETRTAAAAMALHAGGQGP
jgi:DNA-binding CsgD family transcriptional regulator